MIDINCENRNGTRVTIRAFKGGMCLFVRKSKSSQYEIPIEVSKENFESILKEVV